MHIRVVEHRGAHISISATVLGEQSRSTLKAGALSISPAKFRRSRLGHRSLAEWI